MLRHVYDPSSICTIDSCNSSIGDTYFFPGRSNGEVRFHDAEDIRLIYSNSRRVCQIYQGFTANSKPVLLIFELK